MTEEQIHAAVAELPRPQLFKLVKRLHIDSSNLSSLIETATAIIADQICEQVRFALGSPQWVSKVVEALTELKTEARSYWENKTSWFGPKNVSIPAAVTVFPGEVYQPSRRWAERGYSKLTYFHEVDKGGHFAAWEEPLLFASEMRAAFKSLR